MSGTLTCKKGFFIIILSFFLLGLASLASAADLHNDWHYSGDTFTVDGEVIMVTHYDFYDNTVILNVNKNSYIIGTGECRETATKEYCITDIFQDLAGAEDGDHIKFEGGKAYAGIELLIRAKGPEITVSRTFSTTSPELNQEVSVTINIENKGSEGTDSFVYEEYFPVGVVLTSFSEGMGINAKSIIYKNNLPVKSSKTLTYFFKVTDYIEFANSGKFNYTYAGKKTSSTTSSVSIKVQKPYELTASLSPDSVEAGVDKSTLTVKIDDTSSEDITVLALNITIPPFVSVLSVTGELTSNNNKYSWQGIVKPDPPITLSLQVKPTKSGQYQIPVSIKLKDHAGKEFSENKTLTLKAELKQLEPILSVLETTVAEGGRFRVAFSVKNPNENIGFRNIKAKIKSEIFPELDASLAELIAGKTTTLIVNDTLTTPFVDEKKSYEIEAQGSYETTTSEWLNFSKKVSITVTPVKDIITIIQSSDRLEVVQGENFTLTVEIKNNNEEAIQVGVYDDYPAALKLIGGKASDTVSFDGSGKKQAYTYKLEIPLDYEPGDVKIITFASVGGKNYAGNKTITIKVNPRPVEEKNETAQEQPSGQEPQQQQQNQTAEPEQKPEKKPGFISKIFSGISDFFKKLFGKK